MIVKELIEQITKALKEGYIKEDDELLVFANKGEGWDGYIMQGIMLPRLVPESIFKFQKEQKYGSIGFYDKETAIENDIALKIAKQPIIKLAHCSLCDKATPMLEPYDIEEQMCDDCVKEVNKELHSNDKNASPQST